MKQFKQQTTATAGAILIAFGLIGINADQAIAQGKARKGAKVRSIMSPQHAASGLPTGNRNNQTGATSFSSTSKERTMASLGRENSIECLVKKQAGNSARVKSQSERLSVRNGNKFIPEVGDEVLASQSKRLSVRNGNGQSTIQTSSSVRNANGSSMLDVLVSGVKAKSNAQLKAGSSEVLYEKVSDAGIASGAKRRKARNRNGGASFDIRRPKE